MVEEEEDEVVWPHPGVWMVQLVENRLPVGGVKTSSIYICKYKLLPATASRKLDDNVCVVEPEEP